MVAYKLETFDWFFHLLFFTDSKLIILDWIDIIFVCNMEKEKKKSKANEVCSEF